MDGLRLVSVKTLPEGANALKRSCFGAVGGGSSEGIINEPFSDDRFKRNENLRKAFPLDSSGSDAAVDHMIAAPLRPINAPCRAGERPARQGSSFGNNDRILHND